MVGQCWRMDINVFNLSTYQGMFTRTRIGRVSTGQKGRNPVQVIVLLLVPSHDVHVYSVPESLREVSRSHHITSCFCNSTVSSRVCHAL